MKHYPEYRNSGIDWLGEVPEAWPVKRLKFEATLNPSRQSIGHLDREQRVSFLPMEAIGDDGSLRLDETRPISEVENGYTFFQDGDVTIAKITPCFENGKGRICESWRMVPDSERLNSLWLGPASDAERISSTT